MVCLSHFDEILESFHQCICYAYLILQKDLDLLKVHMMVSTS